MGPALVSQKDVMLILSGSSVDVMETEVLGRRSPFRQKNWSVEVEVAPWSVADFLLGYGEEDLLRMEWWRECQLT